MIVHNKKIRVIRKSEFNTHTHTHTPYFKCDKPPNIDLVISLSTTIRSQLLELKEYEKVRTNTLVKRKKKS